MPRPSLSLRGDGSVLYGLDPSELGISCIHSYWLHLRRWLQMWAATDPKADGSRVVSVRSSLWWEEKQGKDSMAIWTWLSFRHDFFSAESFGASFSRVFPLVELVIESYQLFFALVLAIFWPLASLTCLLLRCFWKKKVFYIYIYTET